MRTALCIAALIGLLAAAPARSAEIVLENARLRLVLGEDAAWRSIVDKKTGQEVGAVLMPAAQSGSPMTYMADGRQYIIVAVSGGNYTGEYIAYRLPNR